MDDSSSDDLIEILLWLPVKSLFDFKRVSKRWNAIISSPHFRQLYRSHKKDRVNYISSLLGFFNSELPFAFFPASAVVDDDYSNSAFSSNNGVSFYKPFLGTFIGSSNGLLLYGNHISRTYIVCNPVTIKRLSLPKPHNTHSNVAIGFVAEQEYCRDNECKLKKFKFQVVLVGLSELNTDIDTHQMETFSSETWEWRESMLNIDGLALMGPFEYAVAINGVYYWLELTNRVLAYDFKEGRGQEVCSAEFIYLPQQNLYVVERSYILGESKDGLLQYGRSDCFGFSVWVLEEYMSLDGIMESQWVLRHTARFFSIHHQCPDIMSSCDLILNQQILQNERYAHVPLLVAFHPLNPCIVFLRLGKRILIYNEDLGSVELVPIEGSGHILTSRRTSNLPWQEDCRLFPYFSPMWASLCL